MNTSRRANEINADKGMSATKATRIRNPGALSGRKRKIAPRHNRLQFMQITNINKLNYIEYLLHLAFHVHRTPAYANVFARENSY